MIKAIFSLTALFLFHCGLVLGQVPANVKTKKITDRRTPGRLDIKKINEILQEELACEAARRGLPERRDVREKLNNSRQLILIQALKDDIIRSTPSPSEAEINKAYQIQLNRWKLPEAYQMDAIKFADLNTILKGQATKLADEKPVSDKDFFKFLPQAKVTQKSNVWVPKKNMAPSIWQNLAMMKLNEVKIIDTPEGKFLIRKGNHRKAIQLPLEKVRNLIKNELIQKKAEIEWNKILLENRTKITNQPVKLEKN